MAPRLKHLCLLGSRKELRYTILFSQKVPACEFPPGFPVELLWREMPVSRALTYHPGSPVKEPSTLSLFREKHSIPRAPFIHLSKSSVDFNTIIIQWSHSNYKLYLHNNYNKMCAVTSIVPF
jgi:hypothetical protein